MGLLRPSFHATGCAGWYTQCVSRAIRVSPPPKAVLSIVASHTCVFDHVARWYTNEILFPVSSTVLQLKAVAHDVYNVQRIHVSNLQPEDPLE